RFGRVLPCERHCLSERLFIDRVEADSGGSRSSPGSAFTCERLGVLPYEFLLLFGRKLNHAPMVAVLNRRKYLTVRAEIGMAHMRPLNGAIQSQSDAAKIICGDCHRFTSFAAKPS